MIPELAKIEDPIARRKIEKYLDCLDQWAGAINLTGAQSRREVFETLVLPILGGEQHLTADVIDIGSGNGSPALVLAALRPDCRFTLLEPRAKRWAFLRQAIREMGIDNATVRRERSDQYRGSAVTTATMRAVGLKPETLRPLLEPGGQVLVFGGPILDGAEHRTLPSGASLQRLCFT
ncbi:MAG: RsmG family class I SAM-dependent methyltransferase [Vicinamibacteria bacterium]